MVRLRVGVFLSAANRARSEQSFLEGRAPMSLELDVSATGHGCAYDKERA